MSYVELHACSAFSFLRGGSFPEQLAEVAAELEMPAMALLDRNGVYGAQRFSVAAREHNVRPIIAVALSAEPIRPVSQQFGLFETALRNPQQLYETLARLSALLGSDHVGTPVLEETHRPDAFRMEAFVWNLGGTTSVSSHDSSDATERIPPISKLALRRFRPDASASIFTSQDRHLQSDKIRGQVVDQIGPFLLSGNWWDEKSWARAEYDMQLENGELIRAHESPPSQTSGGTGSADGTWKVDGIYD